MLNYKSNSDKAVSNSNKSQNKMWKANLDKLDACMHPYVGKMSY